MKSAKQQTLITAAFRKLVAQTGIERMMNGDRSVLALTRHFQALPWDTKVFTVTGKELDQWTVDIGKDGPVLTLAPTDSEVEERIEVAGAAFWRHLVAAFEEAHPGLHLEHDESLLERLLHDRAPDHPKSMVRQREDETLRAYRIQLREDERRREERWRAERATEHQYQYAIWYQ